MFRLITTNGGDTVESGLREKRGRKSADGPVLVNIAVGGMGLDPLFSFTRILLCHRISL